MSPVSEKRKSLNLLLFVFIVLLFLVFVAELVFQFYLVPATRIGRIVVQGSIPLSDAELLETAGLSGNLQYYRIDEREVEKRLLANPEILDVLVEKRFPDMIFIKIQGRGALALSLAETETGSVPVVFDQSGVLYQVGSQVATWDLPVLSGIKFEGLAPGMQLPPLLLPLLEDLGTLRRESPALYRLISEIKIVPSGHAGFDFLLFLTGYRLRARVTGHLTGEKIRQIIVVLDALTGQELSAGITEVDFRTGEIVFRYAGDN
jgi:hypothetical protein